MTRPLRILKRVSAMSAHEVATRVRQAAGARLDGLRHRAGLAPAMPGLLSTPVSGGKFFFDPSDVPELAALWKQLNPEAVAATVARAEQIMTRRYPILGYASVDFGDPVDWQWDPVNNKRAQLVPFGHVPYLDFQVVGDHKVTWELSRHQHLLTLVRSYVFTGERRFADEALLQWRHWKKTNPYPLGINWTSTLEVAFRILSWMWMDHLLAGTDLASSELRAEFAQGIGHGAAFIRRYLSTYFAPNTHLMGEAYAMFAVGAVYRQFADAQAWADEGWRIVNEEARKQVFADGFHFEQSTYYHVYSMDFFLHARQLGARNGRDTSNFDEVIPRMAHALGTVSQGGQAPRFGDDDGGRLFDPARNATKYLTDPLATVGAVYGRADWKGLVGGAREETLWLAGAEAVRRYEAMSAKPVEPRSELFADSGQACLAQAGGVLIADAGPHGWGNGAHGHADALSVQLIVGGEALISDPGTGTYPFDTPTRNQLRQTSAHSTLEIDGRGQAEPVGSFKWQGMPRVTLLDFRVAEQGSYFKASHDGYSNLADPVLQQRHLVSMNGSGWLVFDRTFAGAGEHAYRLHWQLPPGTAPKRCEDGWSVVYASGEQMQIVSAAPGWSWQRPLGTQWSPTYGALENAVDLTMECSSGSVNIATVLAPGVTRPALSVLENQNAYRWEDERGVRLLWFGAPTGVVDCPSAFMSVASTSGGELQCVWIAEAQYCKVNGVTVFEADSRLNWIAWQPGDPPPVPGWNPAPLAELFRTSC